MTFTTGFATSCGVLTPGGRKPVGELAAGDTLFGFVTTPLTTVSALSRHPPGRGLDPRGTLPVVIAADAFREGVPSRDVVVSPHTAIVLAIDNFGITVCPARKLVNGSTLKHQTVDRETGVADPLVTIACAPPDLIDIDGLICLPALPVHVTGLVEVPDPSGIPALWRAVGLGVLFVDDAKASEIRRQLHDRAVGMGWRRIARPDVTIRTSQGARVVGCDPDGTYNFPLPAGIGELEIHAPAGMAFEILPENGDTRALSIAVIELSVGGIACALDGDAFVSGFYPVEVAGGARWRWMSGAGVLAVPAAPVAREVLMRILVADWTRTPRYAPSGAIVDPDAETPAGIGAAFTPGPAASLAQWFCAEVAQAATTDDLSRTGRTVEAMLDAILSRGDADIVAALSSLLFKNLSLQPALCITVRPELESGAIRLFHDLHVRTATQLHATGSQTIAAGIDQLIEARVGALQLDPMRHLACVFMTREYLRNFELWAARLVRSPHREFDLLVFVFAADVAQHVERMVRDLHLSATIVPLAFDPVESAHRGVEYDFLWPIKVSILRSLLPRVPAVIYSDLDCYWMGDVVGLFAGGRAADCDICFMASTDMPLVGVRQWGFVPCAGFVRLSATPAAQAFLARWHALTVVLGDDQIAMTELLLSRHAAWHVTGDAIVSYAVWLAFDGDGLVTIGLLSDAIAHRARDADPADIVGRVLWHPRWIHDPDSHRRALGG